MSSVSTSPLKQTPLPTLEPGVPNDGKIPQQEVFKLEEDEEVLNKNMAKLDLAAVLELKEVFDSVMESFPITVGVSPKYIYQTHFLNTLKSFHLPS